MTKNEIRYICQGKWINENWFEREWEWQGQGNELWMLGFVRLWSVYICHLKILAGRVAVLIHYAYAQKNIMNDGPNTEAQRLCVCSWCIFIRFQTLGVWTQESGEKALGNKIGCFSFLQDRLSIWCGPEIENTDMMDMNGSRWFS